MHHVRQENLPFVGSSYEFRGAEQGDTGLRVCTYKPRGEPVFPCSCSMGSPVRDQVRTATLMTKSSSSVKAEAYGQSTARPSRAGAGDIFVIKAGEIHSFKALGDALLVQLDIHLSHRFIQENL